MLYVGNYDINKLFGGRDCGNVMHGLADLWETAETMEAVALNMHTP